MRKFLFAAALLAAATPSFADETTGVVVAFDRVAQVLVLSDKTIWQIKPETVVPAELAAGAKVKLVYQSAGEEGVSKIDAVEIVAE